LVVQDPFLDIGFWFKEDFFLGVVVDGVVNVWWKLVMRCVDALEISEHIGWETISDICLVEVARGPKFESIHPDLMD